MKLYLYCAIALALVGLLSYGVHIHKKAQRVDVAEARAEAAEKAHKASVSKYQSDLKASEAQRRKLTHDIQAIITRFDSIVVPPPKTLVRTVEVAGECPKVGFSAQFVGVWNGAADP